MELSDAGFPSIPTFHHSNFPKQLCIIVKNIEYISLFINLKKAMPMKQWISKKKSGECGTTPLTD